MARKLSITVLLKSGTMLGDQYYSILKKPLHLYPHEQWNYLLKRINIGRRFMVLSLSVCFMVCRVEQRMKEGKYTQVAMENPRSYTQASKASAPSSHKRG
jgi:hypothetical protein